MNVENVPKNIKTFMHKKLTQPLHHILDGSEVFLLFLLRICVIIPQEANSIICLWGNTMFRVNTCTREHSKAYMVLKKKLTYLCIAKIKVDSFGMPNVKDTVGLRRKTGTYLKTCQDR